MSGTNVAIYSQLFCGERQIVLTHFIPLGDRASREHFAFGYWDGDRYKTGIASYLKDGTFVEESQSIYLIGQECIRRMW